MINRSFLIVSLLIATVGGCIYRFNSVTIVLLVLVIVISCFNLNKWFMMIVIILGTPFLLYFIHDAHELRIQSLEPDQESAQISGVILPDEITIDGDNLMTNARLDVNKHIVRLYAKLTSESEKQAWLSEKILFILKPQATYHVLNRQQILTSLMHKDIMRQSILRTK